jgi:MFS family permease
MAMGRCGQIVGPLLTGVLLGHGWAAGPIMVVIGIGGLVAAVFIVLFHAWFVRRPRSSADDALGEAALSA